MRDDSRPGMPPSRRLVRRGTVVEDVPATATPARPASRPRTPGSAPVEAVDSPDGADTADSGAAGAGSRRRALGRGGVDGSLSRTQAKRCEEAKAQAQAQVNQAKEQAEEWAAKIAEELKGFGPAPGKTVARFGRNDIRHFALTRLLDLVSEEERIRINLQNKLGPQFAILAKERHCMRE